MSNPPGSLPQYANIWSTAVPVCVILTVMNKISPIECLFPNHAMSLAYKRYDASPPPILYAYCIHTSANFQEILAVLRSCGTLLGQIAAGCSCLLQKSKRRQTARGEPTSDNKRWLCPGRRIHKLASDGQIARLPKKSFPRPATAPKSEIPPPEPPSFHTVSIQCDNSPPKSCQSV